MTTGRRKAMYSVKNFSGVSLFVVFVVVVVVALLMCIVVII